MNWHSSWHWFLDIGWLVFLFILFYHFWQTRKVLVQASSWLQVKGRITTCEWVDVGHSVWPAIEYSYEVYEQNLIGHHLFLDTAHNNPHSKYARRMAYNVAIAFKEQALIDVYYNPNKPEQSALDVTIPIKLNFILALIMGCIFVQSGLIVWYLLL